MAEVTEAILKLKIQDDEVFSDIDKLAAKLGVVSLERRKAEEELNGLIDQERKLAQARDKANSPNSIAKYNQEIQKTQAQIEAVKQKIDEATRSEQKMTAQTEKLDDTLDKAFQVAGIESTKKEIDDLGKELDETGKQAGKTGKDFKDLGKQKVKIQLGDDVNKFVSDLSASGVSVKTQIRLMQEALLQLDETDPRFEPLKASLTEMKDRFKDFKEDLEANTGEPLEKIGGNFRNLAASILTLDFGQANKALGGLAQGIRGLKFGDVISGIKGMGKNFLDLGKALLTNPIFLIATVIILIIVNFEKLKKAGGLIGDLFRFLGKIIGVVVQAFKDLTDWLGFTNFAFDEQQEALQATIDAYDKLIEKTREANRQQEAIYESERRLAISRIKDAKERNAALIALDEELYLNKLNNRAKDTENLKEQLELQRQQLEANAKQNTALLDFLANKGKDISAITELSGANLTPKINFDSPLLAGFVADEDFTKQKDKLDAIQKEITQNTVDNTVDANNFLAKENERTNQILEDQQKKWEQYLKDRNKIFENENKKFIDSQRAFRQAIIDTQLIGANQIAANFDLQRQALLQQAEDDKKAAAAILNKADAAKFNLEVQKRLTVQLLTLSIRQRDAEIKNAKDIADAKTEAAKSAFDKEIDLLLLTGTEEEDVYKKRFQATQDYYDAKTKASDDFYDAEIGAAVKELNRLKDSGVATKDEIAQQNQAIIDLQAAKNDAELSLELDRSLALTKLRSDRLKAELEANKAELEEEQRHQIAMLDIEGATEAELLDAEIEFEKRRLNLLIDSHQASNAELEAQNNKVLELEAKKNALLKKLDEERLKNLVDGINTVTQATIDGADKILQAQISMYDRLIEAQRSRVEQAKQIAEDGNAELLEEEQRRLDELQKKRERFVRAQQALAVVELIANTAVAVSKAAAEGGAAAPFTVAAALIALVAGLAQARAIASQAAFFKGGFYDGEGYTGDGNIQDASLRLGRKPYEYHNQEFIFNNEKTRRYRDIFERVHKGKIDLREMESKALQFDKIKQFPLMNTAASVILPMASNGMEIAQLREDIHDLTHAVKSQERLSVSINEKGIHTIATKYENLNKRNDKLAS